VILKPLPPGERELSIGSRRCLSVFVVCDKSLQPAPTLSYVGVCGWSQTHAPDLNASPSDLKRGDERDEVLREGRRIHLMVAL
jgi:hypothetical protein